MGESSQAVSIQDLIFSLVPISKPQCSGDYASYIDDFYSNEKLLPRVKQVMKQLEEMLDHPDLAEKSQWIPHLVYMVKDTLFRKDLFKEANEITERYNNAILSWLDRKSQHEEMIDKFQVSWVIQHAITRYYGEGGIDDDTLKLWERIPFFKFIESVYPSSWYYPVECETEESTYFHCDYVTDPNHLMNVYIEIINHLKKTKVTEIVPHAVSCLSVIHECITTFYDCGDYRSYLNKLEQIVNVDAELIPPDIFTLYEAFSRKDEEEQMSLTDSELDQLIPKLEMSFSWCLSNQEIKPLQDFWHDIYYYSQEPRLQLEFYKRLVGIDADTLRIILDDHLDVEFLFENDQFEIIAYLYRYDLTRLHREHFEIAYSLVKCGFTTEGKQVYEQAIEDGTASSAVYNNLGNLYEDPEKQIDCFTKALALDPKNKIAKENLKNAKQKIKDLQNKAIEERGIAQSLTDRYFKKTTKWQKSLLFTIYRMGTSKYTVQDLANITKQNLSQVEKNLVTLIQLGMMMYWEGLYEINPTIEKLVADYVDPKLERQIIQADNSKLYRPIFFHESERTLYQVLLELFPQHFVFPNISLKTIIDVEKIKEHLSSEQMDYFFKAHVDFAIISTSTYVPVIAFEKDSAFHDTDVAKKKDALKNFIFKTSGIPLIRLRFHSGMTSDKLNHEIRQATKGLIQEIRNSGQQPDNFMSEVDLRAFGLSMDAELDLDELQAIWGSIVGEGVAKKSKVIDLKNSNELHVSVSSELEAMFTFSQEQIKAKMQESIPTVKELIVTFY